jgi:hypothetical protein
MNSVFREVRHQPLAEASGMSNFRMLSSMGKIGGEIHTEPKVAANSEWRIATGSFLEGSASALPPNFFV